MSSALSVWKTSLGPACQRLWQQRSARERRLLQAAALLLGVALLWLWGLAPALRTWQAAAQQQAALDRQTRQMQQWQAEARELQAPTRLPRAEALAWLERSSAALLGPQAKLQVQGDQLRLSLQATPASGLSQWLVQARERAQALPQSVRLQRASAGSNPASPEQADPLWSGELTLRLP